MRSFQVVRYLQKIFRSICGKRILLYLFPALLAVPSLALDNDYRTPAKTLLDKEIRSRLQHPIIIEAIRDQNKSYRSITKQDIKRLDQQWRNELNSDDRPLIDAVMAKPISNYLRQVRDQRHGLYTEIIVMDKHGLNVGQSDLTSDYWQGDEDKWLKTYLLGPDAVHISEVDEDESTQTFQAQVSISLIDRRNSEIIGAATVGINIDLLMD